MPTLLRFLSLIPVLLLACFLTACHARPSTIQGSQLNVSDRNNNILTPSEVASAGTITLTNQGSTLRDFILSNDASREAWQQKKAAFPVGGSQNTWLSQFTLSSTSAAVSPNGAIHLRPGEPLVGRLLLSNVWPEPAKLVVVFLIDYQPLLISTEAGVDASFRTPSIAVGEETGYEFALPPLAQGFHHLSIILMPDCETGAVSCVASGQRASTEQRYDLWVGITELPRTVSRFAHFDDARKASTFIPVFDVVYASEPEQIADQVFVSSGTSPRFELVFWGNKPTTGGAKTPPTLPIRIAVFWDDRLTGQVDYEWDPLRRFRLPIDIPMPSDPGLHHLQVVVFQTPDHAQFDEQAKPISFGKATFSRKVLVCTDLKLCPVANPIKVRSGPN